jgi:hypothetical protein
MYLTTNMAATRVGVFISSDPEAGVEKNRQVLAHFFNAVFLKISSAVLELFNPFAQINGQINISLFKAYRLLNAPTSFLKFKVCTLCPQCIYVFCIYLRTRQTVCV